MKGAEDTVLEWQSCTYRQTVVVWPVTDPGNNPIDADNENDESEYLHHSMNCSS